ncbi:hypothetical protein DMB66_04550 [Actinoplanes sp. ATCC 53533]|uniref:hypothetical protein n=1 Tax=Actinoplanes sp. ATCC 53533 TaxID=1288362 RepID=UPI000F7910D5|nr:hypothetical protein [Actinoplanes sp. ATCC 53533]RSM72777.1 hypothetical protein DMB66_04550 [Actinoplanes sp. ATCC 53533]
MQLNLDHKKQLTWTDQAVIGQVLELLAELDRPVRPEEPPCAGAEQVTDTWRLAGTEMAGIIFTDANVLNTFGTIGR